MLEMGIIVAMGLLVLLAKMPWRYKLWFVSNPVIVDMSIFVALTIIHWGTFSGVMVATIGAFFCSVTLSCARWLIGHVERGQYIAGKFDMSRKLSA